MTLICKKLFIEADLLINTGIYAISQTEMTAQLLNDELNAITSNHAAILASSNIGCSLHIANRLHEKNMCISMHASSTNYCLTDGMH